MSTGWTAPGTDAAGTADSADENGAAGPFGPSAGNTTSSAPGPSGRPVRRELVQQIPLFPLRPLSVGEVLGAAMRIYRTRPKQILMLSAAVFGVAYVFIAVFTGIGAMPFISQAQVALEDPEFTGGAPTSVSEVLAIIAGNLGTVVVTLIASAMVTAALSRIAVDEATGDPTSMQQRWTMLRRYALPATGVSVLTSLLMTAALLVPMGLGLVPVLIQQEASWFTISSVLLGLLVGIILSLWMYARTLLAIPALVVEDCGALTAMRRSFALTSGRRLWRPLGIGILLALLYSIALQVVSGVFGGIGFVIYIAILLASAGEALAFGVAVMTIFSLLGAYMATFLLAPYLSAGSATLYADARMRHEAWDIELNRRAQENWQTGPAS